MQGIIWSPSERHHSWDRGWVGGSHPNFIKSKQTHHRRGINAIAGKMAYKAGNISRWFHCSEWREYKRMGLHEHPSLNCLWISSFVFKRLTWNAHYTKQRKHKQILHDKFYYLEVFRNNLKQLSLLALMIHIKTCCSSSWQTFKKPKQNKEKSKQTTNSHHQMNISCHVL